MNTPYGIQNADILYKVEDFLVLRRKKLRVFGIKP